MDNIKKVGSRKISEVKTYPVPFSIDEITNNVSIYANGIVQHSQQEIMNKAFKFHSQGNILKAGKYYQYFIDQGFKDHRVFSNYGNILSNLGKLQEAELLLRKSIKLNPNFAKGYSNLGNILKNLGNLHEAELFQCKAIAINPDLAEAHFNLGNTLRDLGKFKEAELSLRKSIELIPTFAEAHSNLGNTLRDLGKFKEAEFFTRKAIELNPDFAEAHSNLGNILRDLGKLQEAELTLLKAIELNPNFANAHSNLGGIFIDLGKLKEAELSTRKAIELNPNLANAHANLGGILIDLGELEEAELYIRKAIELNPSLAKPYFSLSIIKPLSDNQRWQDQLFSKSIFNNQQRKDLVDIYFARANILEEKCNFSKASYFLKKANDLNRNIYGSDYSNIKSKIKIFYQDWEENEIDINQVKDYPIPIFIVGMPRSGKTMIESILGSNNKLIKCGESPAINKAIKLYLEAKNNSLNTSLYKLYIENLEIKDFSKLFISTTTPMNLIYTGLIISQISKAKIIYCYRNPLDNILEIYKKNLGNKHTYSCSIFESANLWIAFNSLMKKYKIRYSSKIYFLNYDNLVHNTEEEIKDLLNWLDWKNYKNYLNPKLDPTTTKVSRKFDSRIINDNELSSWKNYRDLLNPAIEIFNNIKNN